MTSVAPVVLGPVRDADGTASGAVCVQVKANHFPMLSRDWRASKETAVARADTDYGLLLRALLVSMGLSGNLRLLIVVIHHFGEGRQHR